MPNQNLLKIEQETENPAIDVALDTLKIKKQAIIFANTKRSAEKCAEDVANKVNLGNEEKIKCAEISNQILRALSRPTKQCQRLAKCVERGIAFHHSGLTHKQREIIEDNFRSGVIKIISATPTLAAGVDLPAFRTILKDLRRYGHRGLAFIPVLEYEQMSGRAGRPKFDKYGEAIIISSDQTSKEELVERYIYGEHEKIYSKLAVEPVLRTYLLSLVATNFANTEQELFDFFSRSFYAHQFKDVEKINYIIRDMLHLLEKFGFIKTVKKSSDFVSGDEIGNENQKIIATEIGRRVAELYIDPLTANKLINNIKKATTIEAKPFSYLQAISSTLEMRPLLRANTKDFEFIEEEMIKNEDHLLEKDSYHDDYDHFINSIKTTMFFDDWVNEKDEEYLLERYNVRPGEINYKLNIADWLTYCLEEFSKILDHKEVLKELVKLRERIKHGIKEELLVLTKIKGVGRVRARRLFNNGLKDIKTLKATNFVTIGQIIGSIEVVKDIKKQLGQEDEIKEVKKGTRKGQLSIKKFENKK